MKIIVTGPQRSGQPDRNLEAFLQDCCWEYVPRKKRSLLNLASDCGAQGIIVWSNEGPILYYEGQKLFFHPSMAKNRLSAARQGRSEDLLVKACRLQEGDDFLDCTLGLGADSIVAAYFTVSGKITALEYVPAVAYTIKWGMRLYQSKMPWLQAAIDRIEVINADHQGFLKTLTDQSYDVVYFDPMFEKPLLKSQPIAPLRNLAFHHPLDSQAIREACRVARKTVVLKDLAYSQDFERLGFKKRVGGKHNKINYGVIDIS